MTTKKEQYCLCFIDVFCTEHGPIDTYTRTFIAEVCYYLFVENKPKMHKILKQWRERKSKSHGDSLLNLLEFYMFRDMYLLDTGVVGQVDDEWLEEKMSNGMERKQLMERVVDEALLFLEKIEQNEHRKV